MKLTSYLLVTGLAASSALADPALTKPLASSDLVFEEVDGFVAVEAEHFFKQEKTDKRAWYLTTADKEANLKPDADPNHVGGAGGGAYLEILPDTRKNHGEKLIKGENFINEPGKMAVISYKVHFNTPGKYFVWARIHSTGTEDNGMHVGVNGTWPASGQRMQWTAKRHWAWGSKQRTKEVHGGVKGILFLNIEKAGEHTIQFSMREDGFEFDSFIMTTDPKFEAPKGPASKSKVKSGSLPPAFKLVKPRQTALPQTPKAADAARGARAMLFQDFKERQRLYVDNNQWLAIDPGSHKSGQAGGIWPFNGGTFDLTFHAVGENDGTSTFHILIDGQQIGEFVCPLAESVTEVGAKYTKTFSKVTIKEGAKVMVRSKIGSKDGVDHSRARWSGIAVKPVGDNKLVRKRALPKGAAGQGGHGKSVVPPKKASFNGKLFGKRKPDGDGSVTFSGEQKQWHKITLTLDGPFAHEKDNQPNPFIDFALVAKFTHESGSPSYTVPGYFAADGKAAETSAESGTKWRVHLSPDKPGTWNFQLTLSQGPKVAIETPVKAKLIHLAKGTFDVAETDKKGRDMRAKGRLRYVGKHHLQFAGSGEFFLKAGADAPENFLAYDGFDGEFKKDGHKDNLIKNWAPHVKDWREGDPTWQNGKGKGIIGAINYLAGEGMNVFSFLTLNIIGDDRNVFPYRTYDDRDHLDCSRLDQWEIVFAHGTSLGMYLHFKTQEAENTILLDGGAMGPERALYYRELIARFGHHLALNWNLGEEVGLGNKIATKDKKDWASYFAKHDPYRHHIVIHNGNNHYDLLGPVSSGGSHLTGFSLQTNKPDFSNVHGATLNYLRRSVKAGKPWVVACDEPGDASHSLITDAEDPTRNNARRNALWGNLMAGGAGVEWYFGYKHPHSDLTCQDYRTRAKMWRQCRYALGFFRDHQIPFWNMTNGNGLLGESPDYCLHQKNKIYLVFLKEAKQVQLDLSGASGDWQVDWFDPRNGGKLQKGAVKTLAGGGKRSLGAPPRDPGTDWVVLLRPSENN